MITENNAVSEIIESTGIVHQIDATDEIKRNHLQSQEVQPVADELSATDFTVKFARLKKAMRKRSSNIF